ncbi:MAG: acyl carrier protein [Pseudomonadota bacterium]
MSSKPIVSNAFAADTATDTPLRVVSADTATASTEERLKSILSDVLGLDADDAQSLTLDSGLFGHLPELDSMAVAGLLTEIEDRFDIVIEDDDVDGEMLETFGGLLAFVEARMSPDVSAIASDQG